MKRTSGGTEIDWNVSDKQSLTTSSEPEQETQVARVKGLLSDCFGWTLILAELLLIYGNYMCSPQTLFPILGVKFTSRVGQ